MASIILVIFCIFILPYYMLVVDWLLTMRFTKVLWLNNDFMIGNRTFFTL
jgi:hypothetical protein